MGKIADALRSNLHQLAQSDARSLRAMEQELRGAQDTESAPLFTAAPDAKALLGSGSFQQQSVATLKRLCKENGIKGYSKLKKPELSKILKANGVTAPPPPLESFSKKELVAMLKKVLELR